MPRPLCVLTLLLLAAMVPPAWAGDYEDRVREAREALQAGDAEAAVRAATKAVEAAPEKPGGYYLRGEALGRLRKSEAAIKDFNRVLELDPKSAAAFDGRGGERFKLGQVKESIEDFDKAIALRPALEESHWRRGIAYYYAGRYADGARQFELGKKVYGNDVENAFWHYLCNARKDGVEKARKALLKVGPDHRVPMMKIYDLIQGKAKPEDVIRTAEETKLSDDERNEALFYAHLYIALNYEAEGDAKKARAEMKKAHEHKIGHYMWDVANVDLMKRE